MVSPSFRTTGLSDLLTELRLREDERAYIRARLRKDQGRSARERQITPRDVLNCFKDYKFFLGGFMYFGLIVPGKNSYMNLL